MGFRFKAGVVTDPLAQLNFEQLEGELGAARPHARVSRSTAQAIANVTLTAISFDTAEFDGGSIAGHWAVGAPTRLTCQRAGCYVLSGGTEWQAVAGGNQRAMFLRLNGATYIGGQVSPFNAATGSGTSASEIIRLAVADYVELVVYQDSGGNLNALSTGQGLPRLAMAWVSS